MKDYPFPGLSLRENGKRHEIDAKKTEQIEGKMSHLLQAMVGVLQTLGET